MQHSMPAGRHMPDAEGAMQHLIPTGRHSDDGAAAQHVVPTGWHGDDGDAVQHVVPARWHGATAMDPGNTYLSEFARARRSGPLG